jgi:hypothetical protein
MVPPYKISNRKNAINRVIPKTKRKYVSKIKTVII